MGRLGLRTDLSSCGDQLASAGELLGARVTAIGEQAVVPEAVEALGQHMHEEAANELAGLERHGLVPLGARDPVIFVFEGDTRRIGRDQAAVGNSDTVGVAGEVGQDLLRTGEGALGVDEPVRLPQWPKIGLEKWAPFGGGLARSRRRCDVIASLPVTSSNAYADHSDEGLYRAIRKP